MQLLRPLMIALSTYTRLPLPRVDFHEQDMKYALCFLPLAGVLVGAAFWLWAMLADFLCAGALLRAAGFVLVPLAVTGGIHMDGFLDTCDALASWQPRERKLDILKDPHMGAFAVIRAGMYLLALLGLYGELDAQAVPLICLGFVWVRGLAVLMLIWLPNARGSGMLNSFQQPQSRAWALAAGCAFAASSLMAALLRAPVPALAAALLTLAHLLLFRRMALRQFGGVTGDLAGYCIQWGELAFALGAVLVGRLL